MGASVLSESGDMQGNGLKGIIAGIILVVLCFIVGAQAAESAVSSAAIIAAVVGALVLILMGKRCWWLIFLLGPVVDALPLPGPLSTIPGIMYMAPTVLVYWLLLWGMGYVKIKWRSFLLLDLLVLALAIHVVAAYIRRPVSINFLGLETDTQGGTPYVYFALAFVCYLTLSCIPMGKGELTKVLRWSVWIALLSLAIQFGEGMLSGAWKTDDIGVARIGCGVPFGLYGMIALCAKYSLFAIILNPLLLGWAMLCCGAIVISGTREGLGLLGFSILNVIIIKKEILSSIAMGGAALLGLYMMSTAGVMERMPYSLQRLVSVLPGMKIGRAAERSAGGTWEWRMNIWEMAFDKRAGYIDDYMFGDGYGISTATHGRLIRGVMRGQHEYTELDSFAIQGMWHNGVVVIIHRLGYVGLVLVFLIMILGSVYMFRVCMALRGSPLFFPVVFYVADYATNIPVTCVGVGGDRSFIFKFSSLVLIKLVYCMLRDDGKLTPIWRKRCYVPQMIREHGGDIRNSAY